MLAKVYNCFLQIYLIFYHLSNQVSGRISGIRPLPDIRYPAFGLAGYPAKSVSGASLIFSSNLIEYLREFESICKTVLAHESGDPGAQFNEKTEGRKSRETVSLNKVTEVSFMSSKTYVFFSLLEIHSVKLT
jgi:hypothetical protein